MTNNDPELRQDSVEHLLEEVERLKAEKVILQADLEKHKQQLSRRQSPSRSTMTWILILLACSTAILAPIAVWARRSFLDTNLVCANVVGLILGVIGTLAFAVAGPYPWAIRTRQQVGQILPLQLKRGLTQ